MNIDVCDFITKSELYVSKFALSIPVYYSFSVTICLHSSKLLSKFLKYKNDHSIVVNKKSE